MAINWGNAGNGAVSGAAIGSTLGPWGTAIGGGIGGLAGLFGGNDDDDKADDFLKQIPEQLRPYFEPYINAGKSQLPGLSKTYGDLTSDPGALIKRLGAGYKESPGYKWKLGQVESAINNAEAANGMAGTNEHGQNAGELAGHLADQDFQEYLNKALGVFGTGLSGQQGIAEMGRQSAQDYGNTIGSTLGSRAGLSYERGAQKNQNSNSLLANILTYLKGQK